jgi:hypothetical protein
MAEALASGVATIMAQALSQWAIQKQKELEDWVNEPDPHLKAVKKSAWERALFSTHPGKVVKAKEHDPR